MKSSQDVRFVRQSQVFERAAPQWVATFAENASFSRLLRHDWGQIPLPGAIPVVVFSDGVSIDNIFSVVVGGVVVAGATAPRPHHVFSAHWLHQDSSSCLQAPFDHKQESQLPHSVGVGLEPRSDSEAPADARPLTARLTAKTIAVDAFIMAAR